MGSQIELPVAGPYDLYFAFPMQREEATLELITNTFAFGGVALVLLVGAVAFVVTRQVVIPVRRAAVVAERLSSGKLNERMRSRGEDDLAMLGKSFNQMADSLQSQIRQLEGLSRVQQRFVSDVSHELRTPLTTIRMAGDLLHDSRASFEPVVSRSAELLHNELDRFEELLADLLEISRFDAGAAALDAEATDLRDPVSRAVEAAAADRGPTGEPGHSERRRATAWQRSTHVASSASSAILWSTPSNTAKVARWRWRSPATSRLSR